MTGSLMKVSGSVFLSGIIWNLFGHRIDDHFLIVYSNRRKADDPLIPFRGE